MNKCIRTLLVSVFAISLVLMAGSSTVLADGWANPWVTPVSGDLVFTSTAVAPLTLAGAEKADSGLIVPVGFPTGERQFGGNALVVSGFSSGSANACFSFPTYRYGWRGGVYEWTGSKWMPLPTTIGNPEAKEGAPSTACAPIYGNGTYALIINFNEAEAPDNQCSNFDVTEVLVFRGIIHTSLSSLSLLPPPSGEIVILNEIVLKPPLPYGTSVTTKIINVSPAGSLTGDLSGSGITMTLDQYSPWGESSVVFLHQNMTYSGGEEELTFTVQVSALGCTKYFQYDGSLPFFIGIGGEQ